MKLEPINAVNNQVLDKCHNCGKPLKPNHRDHCKSKKIVCQNYSCRGHFARFCKNLSVNQIDDADGLKQIETKVITKLEEQDDEEFVVFVIKTILNKSAKQTEKRKGSNVKDR